MFGTSKFVLDDYLDDDIGILPDSTPTQKQNIDDGGFECKSRIQKIKFPSASKDYQDYIDNDDDSYREPERMRLNFDEEDEKDHVAVSPGDSGVEVTPIPPAADPTDANPTETGGTPKTSRWSEPYNMAKGSPIDCSTYDEDESYAKCDVSDDSKMELTKSLCEFIKSVNACETGCIKTPSGHDQCAECPTTPHRPSLARNQTPSPCKSPVPLPSSFTPTSKRFSSLCLHDGPGSPQSLVNRARSRTNRNDQEEKPLISKPTCRKSLRSSLAFNDTQVNINPFTPESPTFSCQKTKQKAVKRSRNEQEDSSEAPEKKQKLTLSSISTFRFHQEFRSCAVLGSGEFGSVTKCQHRLDGMSYAIKKSKLPVADTSAERIAMSEVMAHAVLGPHAHVVRYYSAWSEDDHMYIQFEYCNGGSLSDVLTENRLQKFKMSEAQLKVLMLQVADGLKYMHFRGLVHLDIKPGNIFIHRDRASIGGQGDISSLDNVIYKIGDLGHVTRIDKPKVEEGDSRYLPEEILHERYCHLEKADIFSLGLSVYEAAINCEPPKNGPVWHDIREGRLKPKPQHIKDSDFWSLIVRMLERDPMLRPTAAGVVSAVSPSAGLSREELQQRLQQQERQNMILTSQLKVLQSQNSSRRLIGFGRRFNRSSSMIF